MCANSLEAPCYYTIDTNSTANGAFISNISKCIIFTVIFFIVADWVHGQSQSGELMLQNPTIPRIWVCPVQREQLSRHQAVTPLRAEPQEMSARRPIAPEQPVDLWDKTHAKPGGPHSKHVPVTRFLPQSDLTDDERKLFNFFIEVNRHYGLRAEVRIAGGWVRDKLLGRVPNDVDLVVIGPMPSLPKRFSHVPALTAADFFFYIQKLLMLKKEVFRGFAYLPTGEGHPRRLAVAVGKIFGMEVAIANVWAPPNVSVGSDLYEDALRRDLTINSLFYNVHTGMVEDWLGRGLWDLEERRLSTPMAPLDTFDAFPMAPARPLRCIRFACRLNFTLDPGIVLAARTGKVLQDLATRVSRNRLGREVQELMWCPDPHRALTLLETFGFRDVVFQIHPPANGTTTNFSLLRPVAWAVAPTAPDSWTAGLALVARCVRSPFYAALPDPTVRSALTFAALFHGVFLREFQPDPQSSLQPQLAAAKAWFQRVTSYSLNIHQRVALGAAEVVIGALAVPALVRLAALDPPADPETFMSQSRELAEWLCVVNLTNVSYVEPALHFYEATCRVDQPSSAAVRLLLERFTAVSDLYTNNELRDHVWEQKLPNMFLSGNGLRRVRRQVVRYHMAYPHWPREDVIAAALLSLQRDTPTDTASDPG
eukprot:EG_transcript_5096